MSDLKKIFIEIFEDSVKIFGRSFNLGEDPSGSSTIL